MSGITQLAAFGRDEEFQTLMMFVLPVAFSFKPPTSKHKEQRIPFKNTGILHSCKSHWPQDDVPTNTDKHKYL